MPDEFYQIGRPVCNHFLRRKRAALSGFPAETAAPYTVFVIEARVLTRIADAEAGVSPALSRLCGWDSYHYCH